MQGETDRNTVIVEDFNTSHQRIDLSDRKSIKQQKSYDTLKTDLIDIFRTLHQKKIRMHISYKCTCNILQDRP